MTGTQATWHLTETADAFLHAETAAHAVLSKKGEDVSVLDLRGRSDVADFFVIATAGSGVQVRAAADAVIEALAGIGVKPLHVEGGDRPNWMLLDFVDFVVHVLQPKTRDYYRLESLWGDAPRAEIAPEHFREEAVRARHPELGPAGPPAPAGDPSPAEGS